MINNNTLLFNHYLITRFNLRWEKWDAKKKDKNIDPSKWLEHRIELFTNFCLPSVVAQVNKNFKWLIFFDISTPNTYKDYLETLLGKYSFIKYFYIDGISEFVPSIQDFIKRDAKDIPYIITSRIDNDDCISKFYIQQIQDHFNEQERTIIDCIKGFTLQLKPCYMLGKKDHIFNPFISLIEKNDKPTTVWGKRHAHWKKEKHILQIRDSRLWLSLIHNENLSNFFDGYGKVNWNDIVNNFIIDKNIANQISKNLIPYKKWIIKSLINSIILKTNVHFVMLKKKLGFYNLSKK